jgi:hypothetical protein
MRSNDGRPAAALVPVAVTLAAVTLAAVVLSGCRDGGSTPPPVASSGPPTAPATFVPPAGPPQFWARLRALHPKLAPVGPGKPAAEAARLRACQELGAMLRYVDDGRENVFRIENGDFDALENDAKACLRTEESEQRIAFTDVGVRLHRDPYVSPTP